MKFLYFLCAVFACWFLFNVSQINLSNVENRLTSHLYAMRSGNAPWEMQFKKADVWDGRYEDSRADARWYSAQVSPMQSRLRGPLGEPRLSVIPDDPPVLNQGLPALPCPECANYVLTDYRRSPTIYGPNGLYKGHFNGDEFIFDVPPTMENLFSKGPPPQMNPIQY